MKGLAVTSKGIEDIAALEIKELISSESEIKEGCVIFALQKLEELCLLCYKSQSLERVLFLFGYFDFRDIDELKANIKKVIDELDSIGRTGNTGGLKLSDWMTRTSTFRVTCRKIENDLFSSEEAAGCIGELIIENIRKNKGYRQKVELNSPDITFLVFISRNTAYFGVDFPGRELHKRDYKLFAHPASLRPTIAYALIRIGGLSREEKILDPFSRSGEIPIESALFTTNFPPCYYSKEKFPFLKFKPLKKFNFSKFFKDIDGKPIKSKKTLISCFEPKLINLNAAKKNAQIAGVRSLINFSRMDIEWLDTKLARESIDKVITYPPELTKALARKEEEKEIEKLYRELFYQADFILKKHGKIVIITGNMESLYSLKRAAEGYKFGVEEEREVYGGKKGFRVAVLTKSGAK